MTDEGGGWVERDTALARLGVRPQTLYAYVSRGRIGMRPDPTDPRRSLYSADDLEALVTRRARGRRRAVVAESTMAWGEPSIATSISTVVRGRLIYRGQDAVRLADEATLEEVAALLWSVEGAVAFDPSGTAARPDADPRAAALDALADLAARGRATLGRPAPMLHADASEAVGTMARALGARPGPEPLHERLARGWSLRGARASEVLRRTLALLADHELNASTFAARVAASTGASIAASLLAGLCALSGPRHGGAPAEVAALADDAERSGGEAAVARWLGREVPLPGFGHPLYPDGDPRARAMLGAIRVDEALASVRDAVGASTGAKPNVDFALVAVVRALGLPTGATFSLFALGRSVGWAAHAMEQAETGGLIRPRARYEGPPPAA